MFCWVHWLESLLLWLYNRHTQRLCICGDFLNAFGLPLWVSLRIPSWLLLSEVLLGGWIFWIFSIGSSMPLFVHFLVWIVCFLVLDFVVHKLNPAQHERLHIWKTYLACWIVLGKTLPCQIFFLMFSCRCMPYVICNFLLMVQCTRLLLHLVPLMRGCLVYYELLLVSQVGLMVCSCNQIYQICWYRLIGGKEFLIILSDLGWLLNVVIVCPTVEDVSLCLSCTVPLWSVFWILISISLRCLIYNYLGGLTDAWCSLKSL